MIHLTGLNYNPRETIQNIFSPLVGIVTSSLADEICHKNNLSFVELLQPFSKLINEAHFRDTSGTSVSIKGLRLNFCDVDWRPPQTVLARKMLNESVTNAINDKVKFVNIGSNKVEVPTSEPWFENWRETFLTVQFPAEHEFTRHFLSCLLVLSSADPNIVETANKLTQRVSMLQNVTPQKLPKWFQPSDVLNSYVVLHEGSSGDISNAQQSYEQLKSNFGNNKCFLIQMNSIVDGNICEVPDYWIDFIKRQPKSENVIDQGSAPKTPLDSVSVISMPTMQVSTLTEPSADNDTVFVHPLSPTQEQATEAIHSKFSVSTESISSQTINPNVWAADIDQDAPHGACLNAMDVENLRHFVQDYAIRALIPYVEHIVGALNEAITNKKGVSKSLLSATKRWFVTNKPGISASNQNAVIYTNESAELQTRKLGDLYFMFGHYNLAFQAYHQAKRDFNADSAWQYYAGALEMAAVSAFMLGTASRKTYDYMEDAIVCYLTVCKLQQFATRATVLSVECLKTARLYGEAAKQLIRMTTEESDLRSALLLEQAAYCFLSCQPSMFRKYAFHIVLSGNRYSRAGQRRHAFRCYRQAYQVFQDRGWSLAEDHIQYTIAKQAYVLKKLEDASTSFAHLLRPTSMQNVQQQASFLKEYIQTQKELLRRSPELLLLEIAIPKVVQSSIRVLVSAPSLPANPLHTPATNLNICSNLSDEQIWHKIEEMIVTTASANKPLVFKPSKSLFTSENSSTDSPLAVLGEPIEIAVTILNSVKCNITFTEIDLLWKLCLENGENLSNIKLYENNGDLNSDKLAVTAAIKTICSQQIVLEEEEEKTMFFQLTPKLTGSLNIVGIIGQVALTTEPTASLRGCLYFERQRIKTNEKKSANTVLLDNKLSVEILPSTPSLSVSFSTIPSDVIIGEIIPVVVSLRNTGILPIEYVYIGCESPRWITFPDHEAEVPLSIVKDFIDLSNEKLVKDKEMRRQHVFQLLKRNDGISLKAQETATISFWIQAPYQKGDFKMRLLFYYSTPNEYYSRLKYRIVRHEWNFHVHECFHAEANCVISNFSTRDLALDIEFKNLNQMHHPLMAELYINAVGLYSSLHKIDSDNVFFMNQMELATGHLGDKSLKSGKTASIQCRLIKKRSLDEENTSNSPLVKLINQCISSVSIMLPASIKESNIPPNERLYSFLLKNETKYVSGNVTSEEFNHMVAANDPHLTISITWTAVVVNNSVQRTSHGQHFIQLRNLYEKIACPETVDYRVKAYLSGNYSSLRKIFEYTNGPENAFGCDEDESEQWEVNNNFVGKRCLIEDESFSTVVTAPIIASI